MSEIADLVEFVYLGVLDEVGVNAEGMGRVGGRPETTLELAQKRLLAHDREHPLVVDRPASPVKLSGDPTVAVAGELQHDVLYGVPQIEILSRRSFLVFCSGEGFS